MLFMSLGGNWRLSRQLWRGTSTSMRSSSRVFEIETKLSCCNYQRRITVSK